MVEQLIIVGSGPAGFTAAIYAARAGFEPLLIAGAVSSGGALMTTTEVENFPGFPEGVQGPELMEMMQTQAERFGTRIILDDAVDFDLISQTKRVVTSSGESFEAHAVILATGSAYRQLGLVSEQRLSGHGVSWCATCDGFFFREKDVIVVGGGDSAMEEATFLTRFAKSVTLVVRSNALRASQIMVDRAQSNSKIQFEWNSKITEIHGEDHVTAVTLTDTVTGSERTLETSGIFVAIGHLPRTDLLRGQVDLDDAGYILPQGRTTLTNIPGVFACGDVVDSRYRQAITAAASGCSAALDAEKYLADLGISEGLSSKLVAVD